MNSNIPHFNGLKLDGSAIPVAVCCGSQAVSGITKLGALHLSQSEDIRNAGTHLTSLQIEYDVQRIC
jgi:hypothetical protein